MPPAPEKTAADAQRDLAAAMSTLASRPAPAGKRQLTGRERAAVLMLALGEQYGGKIWGLLDDDELHELSVAMSSIGAIEAEFPRDDEPLPAADKGARLRLSLAIEATRVQRILVPLFAGGVVVRVKTSASSHLSGDTLSITPLRLETHALLQALTSNSTQTATGIWQAMSANLNNLANDAAPHADADPWVLVASGLLLLRLNELGRSDDLTI